MAEDEKSKAEFLAKTKKIEGILLQIGKVEDSIAKLNTKIKEAEEAAAAPGPKGDSQGSVGSPPPLNNQAEVIVVLEKALKKAQAALVKLNTKLNKYAGRRRTSRRTRKSRKTRRS
jgi:predicted  nucleic acid-binding Zn-ribbon protein